MNNLSIKTSAIAAKIIQVNNHKMTKATFRQIPIVDFELKRGIPSRDQILGWVGEGGTKWMLWINNGKLVKSIIETNHGGERKGWQRIIDCKEWGIADLFDQLYIAT